jgi:hypothetical protein
MAPLLLLLLGGGLLPGRQAAIVSSSSAMLLPPGNTTMSCEYLTPGHREKWHVYNGSMLLHSSLIVGFEMKLRVVNSTAPASGLRGNLSVPTVFDQPCVIFNASCDLARRSYWNTNFSLMEPRQKGVPSVCKNGSLCPGGGQAVHVMGNFLPCPAPPAGPGGFRLKAVLHFQSFGVLRDELCLGSCCGGKHDRSATLLAHATKSDDEGALPVVEPSASGYQKENPTCVFVAPNSTSAQITNTPPNGNSASKAKHIDPGHYVCTPASGEAPRGLLVFVPGLAAADYTLFAQTASTVDSYTHAPPCQIRHMYAVCILQGGVCVDRWVTSPW